MPWRGRACFLMVYIFFKLIGLLPFGMKIGKSTGDSGDVSYSILGAIYNILLIPILMYMGSNSVAAMFDFDYPYKSRMIETIRVTKATVGTIVVILIWLHVTLTQDRAAKIANGLRNFDRTLINQKSIRRSPLVGLRIPVVFLINANLWMILLVIDVLQFGVYVERTFMATRLPSFVLNWFIIQYSLLLILLEMRFRAINEGLIRLSVTFTSTYTTTEITSDDFTVRRLLDIRNSYELLYKITRDISHLYSLPILFAITVSCGAIVDTSYYLIKPFFAGLQDLTSLLALDSVLYLAMELFPVTAMAISVTRIKNEMELTADAVHDLLSVVTTFRELKSQLKIFSLELLHRRVDFTAYGFFSLDCTLLHSIANMTGTYLVILMQFYSLNLKNECDSRCTDHPNPTIRFNATTPHGEL
ncbi:putative gustatory receptor 28b [Fopius arisanus]|uniref:Gustatory receptor n=1 Tax=Fopius arisanus TaxID=64838 RepID=A0A9R1TFC6_9HYME|nr:PREDICTED: putative gustatory receptor 28b [Fopius arisanus]